MGVRQFFQARAARDPHVESAGQRANRTFGPSITSFLFLAWIVLCEACIAGYAAYRAAESSPAMQGVVTGTAIIGAAAFAIGTAWMTLYVSAPVRQRNEARDRIGELIDQVAELQEPRAFPSIGITIPRWNWGEEGLNTHLVLPVTLTNRGDHAISLQFRLGLKRPNRPIDWLKRYIDPFPFSVISQNVHPPIDINPKSTKTFDLQFWVATSFVEEIRDQPLEVAGKTHWRIPPEAFLLEIEDLVSGARKEGPVYTGSGASWN